VELILRSPQSEAPEQLRIDESTILIGRGSRCDLRLTHRDVSRRHALLQRVGGRLLVVDLCSRTGVLRDGERVETTWLSPGEMLQVGPYALGWSGDGAIDVSDGVEPSALQLFARQPIAIDGIDDLGLQVFTDEGELVATLPLERPITLAGRSPLCKLRLHDDSVSRVHAGVMLSKEGAFAVDLVRRGGLMVNGRVVDRSRIEVGDRLCIGRYRLEVVSGIARTMPRPEIPQTIVETLPPPSVATSTGVPESVVMALVSALADLQRQFHEQSRYQMEVVQQLFQSVRVDLRDEIFGELRRLQEITAEIQATQQEALRLKSEPVTSPASVPETAASETAAAETIEPAIPSAPAASVRSPLSERVRAHRTSETDALVEHAWIAERLQKLEQERASGWEKLRRMLGSGA
jgi:pSer/pThr/pTyr-binding forkhead associated (FHA) protein